MKAVTKIERIWIYEGKMGKSFPLEKKMLEAEFSSDFAIDRAPNMKTSLAISLAGDGSLLSMVRDLGELRHQIPILGIHTSAGLGFLHRLSYPKGGPKEVKSWAKKVAKVLKNGDFD